jgi:hypothetical protein
VQSSKVIRFVFSRAYFFYLICRLFDKFGVIINRLIKRVYGIFRIFQQSHQTIEYCILVILIRIFTLIFYRIKYRSSVLHSIFRYCNVVIIRRQIKVVNIKVRTSDLGKLFRKNYSRFYSLHYVYKS